MKFSEKIEKLRKSKGMSQEDLAQKLNVTRQTISKWELNQTVPDMNKLIEISKIFDVSLDELVNDVEINNEDRTYKESSIERTNKKISIKILIVGIIISLILCGVGIIRQKQIEEKNKNAYNDAYELSKSNFENGERRLEEISGEMSNLKEQIDSMEIEISSMENEKSKIFMEDKGFSERYSAKNNEIKVKETELSNLKNQYSVLDTEEFQLQNNDYTVRYNIIKPIKYLIFYYIAAGVLTLTILISLVYFLVTRKK